MTWANCLDVQLGRAIFSLALIAVSKKLLRIIFAIVRDDTEFMQTTTTSDLRMIAHPSSGITHRETAVIIGAAIKKTVFSSGENKQPKKMWPLFSFFLAFESLPSAGLIHISWMLFGRFFFAY
jgi:hypothetical protein